mmetsp:Transcript_37040/g.86821  ORF Transcript_37040/g.86821 Transcript_37040/m.86821 type:complete len:120 (-) Transcript_37040:2-361(-)
MMCPHANQFPGGQKAVGRAPPEICCKALKMLLRHLLLITLQAECQQDGLDPTWVAGCQLRHPALTQITCHAARSESSSESDLATQAAAFSAGLTSTVHASFTGFSSPTAFCSTSTGPSM